MTERNAVAIGRAASGATADVGAGDPLGSDVMLGTPAMRGLFGSRRQDEEFDLEVAALQVEPRLAEWRDRLDAEGITFGGIAKLEDLAGDRQMLETGALTPLSDPDAGAALRRAASLLEPAGTLLVTVPPKAMGIVPPKGSVRRPRV